MPEFSRILLVYTLRAIAETAKCGCGLLDKSQALDEFGRVMEHESTRLQAGHERVRASIGGMERFDD